MRVQRSERIPNGYSEQATLQSDGGVPKNAGRNEGERKVGGGKQSERVYHEIFNPKQYGRLPPMAFAVGLEIFL